jgi:hypothetical protein
MTTIRPISKLLVVALLLGAAMAHAELINGDFESAGDGWNFSLPIGDWQVGFPNFGGNPGGCVAIWSPFGGPGGLGLIRQGFMCGDPNAIGTCTITVDYALEQIDASDNSGRIYIGIDGGATLFTPGDSNWYTATFTLPCGEHYLELGLQVDPQNNGWRASFDNAFSVCDGGVSSEATNWSTIKALYN